MRISIILAITLTLAISQNAAAAEATSTETGTYNEWLDSYVGNILNKSEVYNESLKKDLGDTNGFEPVRVRTDWKIVDAEGDVIAVPNLSHPKNDENRRFYLESNAKGHVIEGTDFYIIYDKDSGYVKKALNAKQQATLTKLSIARINEASDLFIVGAKLDSLLGNSPDKLAALKQVAASSGGQYSNKTINDYKLYLAAMNNTSTTGMSARELGLVSQIAGVAAAREEIMEMRNKSTDGQVANELDISVNKNTIGNLTPGSIAQLQQSTGMTAQEIKQIGTLFNAGSGTDTQILTDAKKKTKAEVAKLIEQSNASSQTAMNNKYKAASNNYEQYEQAMAAYAALAVKAGAGSGQKMTKQQLSQNQAQAQGYLDQANAHYSAYTQQIGALNAQVTSITSGMTQQIGQITGQIAQGVAGMTAKGVEMLKGTLSKLGVDQFTAGISSNMMGGMKNGTGGMRLGNNGMFNPMSFGSGLGNGQLAFNVAGDFGGDAAGDSTDRELNGMTPRRMPDDFLSSDGKNMMMVCDEAPYDKTSGNTGVVQHNANSCKQSVDNARLGQNWGNLKEGSASVPMVKKGDMGKDGKVDVDLKAPGSGVNSWEGQYDQAIQNARTFVQNHSGTGALIMRKGEGKSGTVHEKDGTKRKPYSDVYKTEEDVYKDGACQLVETANKPAYNVSANKDGTYDIKGKANSMTSSVGMLGGSGSGMSVKAQAFNDTSSAFAPRDNVDWMEMTSGSYSLAESAGDADEDGEGVKDTVYSYTFVCGRKKVWPSSGSYKVAWEDGFDYYSQPQKNKAGSIFVNAERHAKFSVAFPICYEVVYTACMYATWGMGSSVCPTMATRECEDRLCREIVLPPIKPTNDLNFAYNNAPEGPSTAKGSKNADKNSNSNNNSSNGMKNDQSLPYISEEDMGKTKQGKGLDWYSEFGYNGPPIAFPQTGLPANKDTLDQIDCKPNTINMNPRGGGSGCKDLDKLQYWRSMAVIVNRGFKPDGSNQMSEAAHNQSAQVGGLNEAILYQARCGHKDGLNCLCNYDKFVYPGSSVGHAMMMSGGAIAAGNENRITNEKVDISGHSNIEAGGRESVDVIAKNEAPIIFEPRNVPISLDNKAFKPYLGYKDDKDKVWPFSKSDVKGLDNAEAGDMIIYDSQKTSAGVKARPWAMYKVLEKHDDGCIRVSGTDRGVIPDISGRTEANGIVSTPIFCPGKGGGASSAIAGATGGTGGATSAIVNAFKGMFNIKGFSGLNGGGDYPSCANVQIGKCSEPDWSGNAWTVQKANSADYNACAYNPVTGKPSC